MSKDHFVIVSLFLSMITACTLPHIPIPTAQTAIVKTKPQVTQILMAETLDRQTVNDGRYFEVTQGKHRLTLLFQYNASETAGLFIGNNSTISCLISFYGDFTANTTYYIQASPSISGANVFLKKDTAIGENIAISNTNVGCGPY